MAAKSRIPLLPLYLIIECLILMVTSAISAQAAPVYELIFMTDSSTERSGSITLMCRNAELAQDLEVDRMTFWLNRTSPCDSDLRSRKDIQVIKVDDYRIKFNLTRNLEGIYTCGNATIQDNRIIVQEINPKTLICKFCVHSLAIHVWPDINFLHG